jgi:hypothetical protein
MDLRETYTPGLDGNGYSKELYKTFRESICIKRKFNASRIDDIRAFNCAADSDRNNFILHEVYPLKTSSYNKKVACNT